MKQIILLFLMTLMPMVVSADDGGNCGDWNNEGSVTWKWVESTHTITISGNGAMKEYWGGDPGDPYSYGPIPWDNYKESIQKLIIESGVTSVAGFNQCTNLTSVTLPNTISTIGNLAFLDCAFSSFTIPTSVEKIGYGAFRGCSNLTSITIPSNVTSIDSYPFAYCSSLSSIQVNSGNSVFDSRNNCNAIIEKNGDNIYLVAGCKNTVIPNGVTYINAFAFAGCTGLTSLTIPQSVKEIKYPFEGCDNLSAVYCYATVVPNVYQWRYSSTQTIGSVQNATLYVPSVLINDYQNCDYSSGRAYWREQFKAIMSIESASNTKCATPTIKVNNGILNFECATEGVKFHYKVTSDGVFGNETYTYDKDNDGGINGVILPTITISVYASKEGYSLSDTATKIIKLSDVGGKRGDLNGDGEVNVADHVELTTIIMNQ